MIVATAVLLCSCQQRAPEAMFRQVPPALSGLHFANDITETDSFNILTYEYIYNGGGVALSDVNGDGLLDIFFTGNMVPNRLYLNRGNLTFEDISSVAGIAAPDRWCSGVAVVDINHDGREDLYVATNTHEEAALRRNLLFVNQGNDGEGRPKFREEALAYGLADTTHTMNASFFDYDNDGDLDVFMIVNEMQDHRNPVQYRTKQKQQDLNRVDRLYRNDWDDARGHPVFTDVSAAAGINVPGYSLGVNTTDIDQDGDRDIYVSNDFISNDVLYLNQGDGTFVDVASEYFKHTSHSAMGNDVADINNDGLPDIIALDMLPEDNYRRKTMIGAVNYMTYINNRRYGYDYQFVRNTLQLNMGSPPGSNELIFSDVALLAGISATDWSWTPLVADFDHSGHRDLIITNGFPKDITDHDFTDYQADVQRYASTAMMLAKVPEVKIRNYAYANRGDLTFEDVTEAWGLTSPSFSNGAAYGDLDGDGDLDFVVNNISDTAFLYENRLSDERKASHLRVRLVGPEVNPHGLGAQLTLHTGHGTLYAEQNVYRGYLSSIEPIVHFGLALADSVESLEVRWPDGRRSLVSEVGKGQLVTIHHKDAAAGDPQNVQAPAVPPVLQMYDSTLFSNTIHQELDYVDFNVQPLLPHKLSQFGPGLAVADVNGDGLDDLYMTGSAFHSGLLFRQQVDGSFHMDSLSKNEADRRHEELGALFFDADNDGDEDLYLVSGGYEFAIDDSFYHDRFFFNEGGAFTKASDRIPQLAQSGSCVRAADFDRDGDLDLFVGGRLMPHAYPKPVNSYLLINLLDQGQSRFEVADSTVAPDLVKMGMVTDALWTDYDQDGWVDLLVAGEWMPITLLQNQSGSLVDVTGQAGLSEHVGWWNSLTPLDYDLDGDVDYVAGNFGVNMAFEVAPDRPVSVYGKDFDGNAGYDAVVTAYYDAGNGQLVEAPIHTRGDYAKQMISVKDRFPLHKDYASASIAEIIPAEQREGALVLRANFLQNAIIQNQGDGTFEIAALPVTLQRAPIYGILASDLVGDERPEVLMVGNDYGAELLTGRCDAFNGSMVSLDSEAGGPEVYSIRQSGFFVPGDAKSLVELTIGGRRAFVAGQNQGPLLAFRLSEDRGAIEIELDPLDVAVLFQLGRRKLRKERHIGAGFLSQSHRRLSLPADATEIQIVNSRGEQRTYVAKKPS